METKNLEELFTKAAENPSDKNLDAVIQASAAKVKSGDAEIIKSIETLLESWGDTVYDSVDKSSFCLALAEIPMPESLFLRNLLGGAVKKMLPPYLSKSGFYKALGLRDNNVSFREIANRFKALLKLKNGVAAFQPDTHKWVQIANVDEFTSTVAVASYNGSTVSAVPLSIVLSGFKIFNPAPELNKLARPDRHAMLSSSQYRALMKEFSYTEMYDELAKEIAFYSIVPDVMSNTDFEKWWISSDSPDTAVRAAAVASAVKKTGKRRPSEARSVQEMNLLLEEAEKNGTLAFDSEDTEKFIATFTAFKPLRVAKDHLLLAEGLALIASRIRSDNELQQITAPLKGKCPFWPESLDNVPLEQIDVWGLIPAKALPEFVRVTRLMFSPEYLAKLINLLPLRCLNTLCPMIDYDVMASELANFRNLSCDILLWIWKNRSKLPAKLSAMVNIENIVQAISVINLPKNWGGSQREVRRMLVEKEDFQKYVIANAGDANAILFAMQRAKNLNHAEQQSLLVKLSRYSLELRDLLEKGESKKQARKVSEKAITPPPIPVTSVYSYNVRAKELEDIIKIHTPENREAIKTARAHGDFRENAEYDAAKERRNFLSRRRAELERDLNEIQKIDLGTVKIENYATIGSTVSVQMQNGKVEIFYLLGAWDGDPDNNCLSYKTKLGEIILGTKVGDSITMLDGTEAVIKEVTPLPSDIIKKYSNEK